MSEIRHVICLTVRHANPVAAGSATKKSSQSDRFVVVQRRTPNRGDPPMAASKKPSPKMKDLKKKSVDSKKAAKVKGGIRNLIKR